MPCEMSGSRGSPPSARAGNPQGHAQAQAQAQGQGQGQGQGAEP